MSCQSDTTMASLVVVVCVGIYFSLLAQSTAGYRTYTAYGNRVVLAGTSAVFKCSSSYYRQPKWHFYSLTFRACSFGSGTYPCASASRASLTYLSTSYTNRTTLTISRMEMSDAGTYMCSGNRFYYYWSTASSIILGVIASPPTVTSSVTDGCILKGQNVRLTCDVMYNGTSLMPLMMRWSRRIWQSFQQGFTSQSSRTLSTVNASSVYRSSYAFTANGQTTDYYSCAVTFSRPTGIVLTGVERQYNNRPYITPNQHNHYYYVTSLFAAKRVANCSSSEIEFTVNSKAVDSGASFSVGDILACSAEEALSYRWTNGADVLSYGQTVSISQPGTFTYECSVFMDCGTGLNCPFSRNISGFARELITTTWSISSILPSANAKELNGESYKSATTALAILLVIGVIGVIVVAAIVLYRRNGHKLCVRPSAAETSRNDLSVNRDNEIENQYVNSVALAAANDEQAGARIDGDKPDDSLAVYQDLNVDAAGSADPRVYETIKPHVQPKPRSGHRNA